MFFPQQCLKCCPRDIIELGQEERRGKRKGTLTEHLLIKRHWLRFITQIVLLNLQDNLGRQTVVNYILQMQRLSVREAKYLVQSSEELRSRLRLRVNISSLVRLNSSRCLAESDAPQNICDYFHSNATGGIQRYMRHVPHPKGGMGMKSGVEVGSGRPDSFPAFILLPVIITSLFGWLKTLHVGAADLTLFSTSRLL